jgi:phenylalanyl-tRNA synthetase beta chain
LCGLEAITYDSADVNGLSVAITATTGTKHLATIGKVSETKLKGFDIKQPVFFVDFDWLHLVQLTAEREIIYKEVAKFPPVQRDLALVVNTGVTYKDLENAIGKVKIGKLQQVQLFDIFESEKLGENKKSMAVSFTFIDEEKTLTDKEIDEMMTRLVDSIETELHAEIRK